MNRLKAINIYVDGVFDLTHYGHFSLFEKIKKVYPFSKLIVGIAKDEDCILYKKRSILTQEERAKTISYCKYVDYVLTDIPWLINSEFISKHNITYICHDPRPYKTGDNKDIYKEWKDKGIFLGFNRQENISTSELVDRVKNQHQIQSHH